MPIEKSWLELTPAGSSLHHWSAYQRGPAGTGTLELSTDTLVWSLSSDGSWIANAVALGNGGTQVISEYGALPDHTTLLSAFDANPPTPVWVDSSIELAVEPRVSAADAADVHVALRQTYPGNPPVWREIGVRRYGSSSDVPTWDVTLPLLVSDNSTPDVFVSEDGQRTVVVLHDHAAAFARVYSLDPATGDVVAEHTIQTLGPFTAWAISADGSTVALASSLKLEVLDVDTGASSLSKFLIGEPNQGALGLSGDGSLFAYGTNGEVQVYSRNAQGMHESAFVHPLDPQDFCRRLAISADGSTLAYAHHTFNDQLTLKVGAVDIPTGGQTMYYEVSGGGGYQNLASCVSISADGKRFAVGSWGDEDGLAPELLAFGRYSTAPLLAVDLPGSVLEVDLSGDGRYVAVASKGVHANEWGGGGALSLWRVGAVDLRADGVPHLGATIEIHHSLRSGGTGQVYWSTALADPPVELPQLGPGLVYLDPDSMQSLPPATAGDDGVATSSFTLPDDPALIGTTLYFQALATSGGSGWSRTWIPVTILP